MRRRYYVEGLVPPGVAQRVAYRVADVLHPLMGGAVVKDGEVALPIGSDKKYQRITMVVNVAAVSAIGLCVGVLISNMVVALVIKGIDASTEYRYEGSRNKQGI